MNKEIFINYCENNKIIELIKENVNNPFGKREVYFYGIDNIDQKHKLNINNKTFISLIPNHIKHTHKEQINEYTYIHHYETFIKSRINKL